jgi:hypothetical protein
VVLVEVLNRFDNNADNCVQGEQEWNDGSELLKGVTLSHDAWRCD